MISEELKNRIKKTAKSKSERTNAHVSDVAFDMSQKIFKLRLSKGLTQKQFARKTGFKQPSIARWESGQVVPSLESLDKIAKELNVKFNLPEFIFEDKGFVDSESIEISYEDMFVDDLEAVTVRGRSHSYETEQKELANLNV